MARASQEVFEPEPGEIQAVEQEAMGDIAILAEPMFEHVKWSIWRVRTDSDLRSDPNGERVEYVGTRYGSLDASEFQRDFGGGTFDLRGYVDRLDAAGVKRGVHVKYRPKITIAGPRKDFTAVAAAHAGKPIPEASPSGNGGDPIARLLERMDERLSRLEAGGASGGITELISSLAALDALRQRSTPAPVPAPPATGIGELVAAMKGLHEMAGGGRTADDPVEMARVMMDVLRQGVTMGQEREPLPAGATSDPDYSPLISKGLEILQTVLTRRPPPRPPGPPPPGGQAPPVPPVQPKSEAQVVEDIPMTPPTPPAATPEHRWHTAVEALYRAMTQGRDAGDFASSLEDILNPNELAMIADPSVTAGQVLEYLAPIVAEYPDLAKTQGKVYLESVLAALRAPDDEADA